MPVDTSIPLSGQQVNPMQSLASVVQTAGGIQAFKNAQVQGQALQQQAEQGAQDLRERQHAVGILKNIKNYQDAQGNIDYSRLAPDIMAGAPTTGAQYIQNIAQTQQSAASARKAVDEADANERQIVGNLLYSLKGKPPMMVHDVLTGVKEKYPNLLPAVEFSGKYLIAPAVQGSNSPNPQLDAALDQAGRMFQGSQTQQAMRTGQVAPIATAGGTQLVQTAQGAEQPQGAKIGEPLPSPNQITGTPSGGLAVVNPSTGTAKNLNGDTTPPLTNFPAGETNDTMKVLQDQRTSAQTIANQAPVLHDINREVKATLAKGITTGQLGGTIAKLKSTLGIGSEVAEQGASDYDILGKMLERSALTSAQGMGPQTNAGLEAQIKANGSQAYNPTALKKIANLNDALVTGSEKYQAGLERAIETNPSGVFAKRKFDQQWAANADPMALRLLNAAKSGDKEEINDIFKTVGGPKSKQGQDLRQKLINLKSLSETGQLQ